MKWSNRFARGTMFGLGRNDRYAPLARTQSLGPGAKRHASRIATSAGIVIVVGVAYACALDSASTGPRDSDEGTNALVVHTTPTAGQSTAPPSYTRRDSREVPVSTSGSHLAMDAIRRVSWVGDIHNAAMRDLMANRDQWVGKDLRDKSSVCRGIAQLALKYMPQLRASAKLSASSDDDKRVVRRAIISARNDCADVAQMSMFAGVGSSEAPSAWQTEGASEAWLPHAQNLIAAVQTTDASVAAVAEVVNQTLNSASELSGDDFQTLAAVASLTNSSAEQWNSFGEAGGFDHILPEPMSLFPSVQWWRSNTMKTLYSDVAGCITGALKGGGGLGCAIWGLGSSGLFIISIL